MHRGSTLNALDYGRGDNRASGFTERWVDRDTLLAKKSEVYIVREMAAATRWVEHNGTKGSLEFEEW